MYIKHAIFSRVSGNGMRRRFILKITQNLYLIIDPRYSLFLVGFSLKTIFDPPRSRATLASKDLELYCVSFGLH